jgi:hypothetical protein
MPLTGLTGVDPSWIFAQVNMLVSSLLSCVAAISSLVRFGTRKVRFVDLVLSGLDQSDRRATPA